jgi:hypothetical protein
MSLRMLTFGDLQSGIWGAAWDLGEGRDGFSLVGGLDASLTQDWRLTGDQVELESSAASKVSELPDGFDELITVRGRIAEQQIDCLGRRGVRNGLDPASYSEVRDVSGWFSEGDGLALLAARPPGAPGHADDVVSASLFEAGKPLRVEEPRLSTTYGADRWPVRVGVEMWLEVERPGDDETEEHIEHYPRRAAGEAAGDIATTTVDGLAIEARPFRWHAHGRDGVGVYVLAQAR